MLSLALVCCLTVPQAPSEPSLRGRCCWEALAESEPMSARAVRHSALHGWRLEGGDRVAPAEGAACAKDLLDRFEGVLEGASGWGELEDHAALALARHGRIDFVVRRATALTEADPDTAVQEHLRTRIARTGAILALDGGRPSAALELTERWQPIVFCLTCSEPHARTRKRLRTRALLARGDPPDLVRRANDDMFRDAGVVLEAWCERRWEIDGAPPSDERIVARFGADVAVAEALAVVRRISAAFADPAAASAADLGRLLVAWPERGTRALLALPTTARERLIAGLEPTPDALSTVFVRELASIGFLELGPLLARVESDAWVVGHVRARWERESAIYAELARRD